MAKGGPRETKQSKQLGKGLAGAGFLLLRTISNFAYEMIYNQSETARTAVSGSGGMDAVASGSSGFIALPISLVKSDWKLQQKTGPRQPFSQLLRLLRLPWAALCHARL